MGFIRMSQVTFTGKVVGKAGEPAVTVREFKSKDGTSNKLASFSVCDKEYSYFKNKEDNPGQFYRVEVSGRFAEMAFEQLKLGSWVYVSGQGVWRTYNNQKFFDVKNSKFMLCEDYKSQREEPF